MRRPLGDISTNRRTVVTALPGVIVLPCFLAGCASESPAPTPSSAPAPAGGSSPAAADGSSPAASGDHIDAAQVPVGSAVVVPGAKPVVVAQPTAGQFVAFSASCTHRGTTVAAQPGSTTLRCPAHGSEFDAATGKVLKGPAAAPLPSVPVTDANGVLTLG